MVSIRTAISCLVAGGILIAAFLFGWFIDRGSEAALKQAVGQILDREQEEVLRQTSDFFGAPLKLLQWIASSLDDSKLNRKPSVAQCRALRQMLRIDALGWFDAGSGEVLALEQAASAFEEDSYPIDVLTLSKLTSGNAENVLWAPPYRRGDERNIVSLVAVRIGQSDQWLWMTLHLEALSDHVSSNKEGAPLVYILDERDRLVAFPTSESRLRFGWQLGTAAPEKWLLRPMTEVDDPAARAFLKDLRKTELAKREFDLASPTRFLWDFQGLKCFVSAFEVAQPTGAHLRIYICVAYEPLVGPIVRTLRHAFWSGLIVLVFFMAIAILLGRKIDSQMLALNAEMELVSRFQIDSRPLQHSRLKEIIRLRAGVEKMKAGLRSFQRYVPIELVRDLLELGEEARMGGESRHLSVMFCDLAGFTNCSESLTPAEATEVLTAYFKLTERLITTHRGTLDKYLGDGVMAFWGAPRAFPEMSQHACAAALAIQREASASGVRLQIRVGIAEGPVLVGNIGTVNRINYTAIGATVNFASRLEGIAKYYGAGILLSESAAYSVCNAYKLREVDRVLVLGSEKPATIWELLTTIDDPSYDEMIASYALALKTYRAADFSGARELVVRHRALFPQDRVAASLQSIIEQAARQQETSTWDAVTRMAQK